MIKLFNKRIRGPRGKPDHVRPTSWGRTETSRTAARRVRSWMGHAVEAGTIPGAVVLIAKRGEVLLEAAAGYRDLERGRKLRLRDLFFLASATKPLATTAILTLVDDGVLNLDRAPLGVMPSLGRLKLSTGERIRAPTLREMLSHTSGIFGVHDGTPRQHRLVWNFGGTLAQAVEEIVAEPLNFPPGQNYAYGGASMSVVARVVEVVTGLEFDEFVNRRLFLPLELSDTFYRSPIDQERRRALVHKSGPNGLRPANVQPWEIMRSYVLAPGGVTSTARDLLVFLNLHLNRGMGESQRIFSEEIAVEMIREQTHGEYLKSSRSNPRRRHPQVIEGQGCGLGWHLSEIDADGVARIFFHGGSSGVYIWADRIDGLAVILLTQVSPSRSATLWRDIIKFARGFWGTPPKETVPVSVAITTRP